jgi:hypothetical protein
MVCLAGGPFLFFPQKEFFYYKILYEPENYENQEGLADKIKRRKGEIDIEKAD